MSIEYIVSDEKKLYLYKNSIYPFLYLMEPQKLIEKYYYDNPPLLDILLKHSRLVTEKALSIAKKHPELNADTAFIAEAAMLHDIGIFMTNAPTIHCFGDKPYICHGYLGRELLEKEGLPRHALVCERHTGTGLSLEEIKIQSLPLPLRDMRPVSIEEQIICFADKFYSKSGEQKEKNIGKIIKGLSRYGDDSVKRFKHWYSVFMA